MYKVTEMRRHRTFFNFEQIEGHLAQRMIHNFKVKLET